MHRLPSITAIVPGLGSDEGGADDAAGLGADEDVNVGFGAPVASCSSMASSGEDDACSFPAVDSSLSAGPGDCVSADKMICGGSSCVAATSALIAGFSGVTVTISPAIRGHTAAHRATQAVMVIPAIILILDK